MATQVAERKGPVGLDAHGLVPGGDVHWNLSAPELYEHVLRRGEGRLAEGGALVVSTGRFTGRSPKDKYVVKEPKSQDRVWWGPINQEISEEHRASLRTSLVSQLDSRPELYVVDAFAGAHPTHRLSVRVVTESAWHALFARNLFITPNDAEYAEHRPEAVVLHAPSCTADPETQGTRSTTFVVLHLTELEILVGGTEYSGEIKKGIFSLMNDRLPVQDILSMHCSANVGEDGRSAIFFGLSGTGKTTLSTDSTRPLIGDDEHAWGDDGVFNIEGGCYAKTIGLSATAEPEIYGTTKMFGTILENVILDDVSRIVDLDDGSITENTRAAYSLEAIPNSLPDKRSGHPSTVIMLTADAFGVLPPVAKLTPEQASEQFLAGYTAKLAGTEIGVTEPQATFSACFGAAFLPQPPKVYAAMLAERIAEHGASAWLINTGWTGGSYGVGSRMPIAATRAIVRAALSGELDGVATTTHPIFGLEVPTSVPGVDSALLDPRSTWADPSEYDAKATELAESLREAAAKAGA